MGQFLVGAGHRFGGIDLSLGDKRGPDGEGANRPVDIIRQGQPCETRGYGDQYGNPDADRPASLEPADEVDLRRIDANDPWQVIADDRRQGRNVDFIIEDELGEAFLAYLFTESIPEPGK